MSTSPKYPFFQHPLGTANFAPGLGKKGGTHDVAANETGSKTV